MPEVAKSDRGNLWEIYRFEFVYFDPRYQRWQYFQENEGLLRGTSSSADEAGAVMAPHRRLIQQLLNTVRFTFGKIVENSPFNVAGFQAKREVRFQSGKRQIFSNMNPDTWRSVVVYLKDAIPSQGIAEKQRRDLEKFFESETTSELPFKPGGDITLPADAALELLSLLPVLRDWELPGCWWRAWNEFNSNATEHATFPPNWGQTGIWVEPFYLARLNYDYSPPRSSDLKTVRTLGYQLQLEAVSEDLAFPDMEPLDSPLRDYFHYCRYPEDSGVQQLYHMYSFFLDHILRELSKGEENSAQPETKQYVSVFGYPILVPGWRHFLQIYVRPIGGGEYPLRKLWNDWQIIHAQLIKGELRRFLSETLQRVNTALFQKEFGDALSALYRDAYKQPRLSGVEISDKQIRSLLCEHASSLFPFESLTASDGSRFSYAPQHGDNRVLLGEYWKTTTSDTAPTVGGFSVLDNKIEVRVPRRFAVSIDGQPQVNPVDRGRVIQLFEQQFVYATTLKLALEQQRTLTRQQRQDTWIQLEEQIHKLSPPALQALREEVEAHEDDIDFPLTTFPQPDKTIRKLMEPCFESTGDAKLDQQDLRDHFWRLVAPTLPLAVSEYFGLGPIKRATHPIHYYYQGNIVDIPKNAEMLHRKVVRLCDLSDQAYLTKINGFHELAISVFETFANVKLPEDREQAQNKSNELLDQAHHVSINGRTLLQERKDHYTFNLVWEDALPKHSDKEVKIQFSYDGERPDGLESFELHWPVHESNSSAFGLLKKLLSKFEISGTWSFAAATRLPYRSEFVRSDNPPKLFKNYLMVRYSSKDDLSVERLREHGPKAFALFDKASFNQYGRLWVSVFHRNQTERPPEIPLYGHRSGAPDSQELAPPVSFEVVFPLESQPVIDCIRRNVFEPMTLGNTAVLVFEFESWRHI